MRLTKHTDYAFRVLIYLGLMDEETTTINAMVEHFDISKSHVMKIVSKLVAAGYIKSSRGKHGGIKLGQAADTINLRRIVELMEHTLDPVDCNDGPCRLLQACKLKGILNDAQAHYLSHLEGFNLSDLIHQEVAPEQPLVHKPLQF
ncbi:MAG: Rrf2 family transcriptional regulator [Gammaproteobacteria bacterium]|nr:Rrf2 family transcriptional regulator [Gammaproteobacteria bacterium]